MPMMLGNGVGHLDHGDNDGDAGCGAGNGYTYCDNYASHRDQ